MNPPLEPPDSFRVMAARGWFELGNYLEANAELEQITPENRGHPDVLRMRWAGHLAAKNWDLAIEDARILTVITPDDPGGWGALANTLYFAGRTQEAREALKPVIPRFPNDAELRYTMACYESQLGHLVEAKDYLRDAFGLNPELRQNALDDPDLRPMWEQIGNL